MSMSAFNARMTRCEPGTRAIMAFLRGVAQHAGDDVEPPRIDGRAGVGISYRRGGRRFCRFDAKEKSAHVWVCIPGASREPLGVAGTVSNRRDGPWVKVKTLKGAVRLVPEILRAYDARNV
jgi:hypothetical protein